MALVGLDRFRERFAAHADRYLLIGGAAGLPFRATKDLDRRVAIWSDLWFTRPLGGLQYVQYSQLLSAQPDAWADGLEPRQGFTRCHPRRPFGQN